VARVARTEEEVEAERDRIARIAGSGYAEPDPFRSHFTGGALQYDDAGRAWVRTERGVKGQTTFDIFSADGGFLGAVSLPVQVKSPGSGFDLAGEFLVTVHEDAVTAAEHVTLWRVTWHD